MITLGILALVLVIIALPFALIGAVAAVVLGDIFVAGLAIYLVVRLIKKLKEKRKSKRRP